MITSENLLKREYGTSICKHSLNLACLHLTQTTKTKSRYLYQTLIQTHTKFLANALLVNWLSESNIKYNVKSITPVSQPLNTSIFLGGWRLVPYINLFPRYGKITQPDLNDILESNVYINIRQWFDDTHTHADLLVLGYNIPKMNKQLNNTSGVFHMPISWQTPNTWEPMSGLKLQNRGEESIKITIYGMNASHQPISSTCEINYEADPIIPSDFYTVNLLLASPIPTSDISISIANHQRNITIQPNSWQPWIPNTGEFIFMGFLPYNTFKKSIKKASRRNIHPVLGRLSHPGWYIETRSLKPLSTLIKSASTWQMSDKNLNR